MTRELAMVHAREGIRVNSLCPCVLFTILAPPIQSLISLLGNTSVS